MSFVRISLLGSGYGGDDSGSRQMLKYFSEVVNVLESGEVKLEERPAVCGNALEALNYLSSHLQDEDYK